MPRRIRSPRASARMLAASAQHLGILGELAEGLRVDADREDAEPDLAAVDEDRGRPASRCPRMRSTDEAKWLRYVNV